MFGRQSSQGIKYGTPGDLKDEMLRMASFPLAIHIGRPLAGRALPLWPQQVIVHVACRGHDHLGVFHSLGEGARRLGLARCEDR